ncbi:MvaI/BcnI family restriction endonuclease [Paenibacillus polymyxa]|uniref:MvaI/BcnI family restriction endonuclease n=2 Tax=Paenibacillus TaxID=44249 RepID=UPI00178C61CE|nr:MvaI/BcnI family restriction endonuclease [Paenibacillus polymyxa]
MKTSFYRPNTKLGDPRIWIYEFKKYIPTGTLIYFTTFQGNLVVIPLITGESLEILLPQYFGRNDDYLIVEELMQRLSIISNQRIKSISPFKSSPKDVGETLEKCLGISPNSIAQAYFKGAIELKCKRASGGNLDTLFSMVPNWDISALKSSTDIC